MYVVPFSYEQDNIVNKINVDFGFTPAGKLIKATLSQNGKSYIDFDIT